MARWSCVAEQGLALPTAPVTPEMIRRPHLWTRLYSDSPPQSPADVSPGSQDLCGGALGSTGWAKQRAGWGACRAPGPAPAHVSTWMLMHTECLYTCSHMRDTAASSPTSTLTPRLSAWEQRPLGLRWSSRCRLDQSTRLTVPPGKRVSGR